MRSTRLWLHKQTMQKLLLNAKKFGPMQRSPPLFEDAAVIKVEKKESMLVRQEEVEAVAERVVELVDQVDPEDKGKSLANYSFGFGSRLEDSKFYGQYA
jgi:hypothetical protein